LRDRGFACFLLDISPHWHALANVDGDTGGINSRSSPACHSRSSETRIFAVLPLRAKFPLAVDDSIREERRERERETRTGTRVKLASKVRARRAIGSRSGARYHVVCGARRNVQNGRASHANRRQPRSEDARRMTWLPRARGEPLARALRKRMVRAAALRATLATLFIIWAF